MFGGPYIFCHKGFDRYGIDIPALSETRIAKETQFEEVDGGYTFYCLGKDEGETRISVVGFAICTSIVRQLESLPKEVNDRLMQLRVMIGKHQYVIIVSAYAPAMTKPEESKDAFYEELSRLLDNVNYKDKLILPGDFNARVRSYSSLWPMGYVYFPSAHNSNCQ